MSQENITTPPVSPAALRVASAASYLGVSRGFLNKLAASGELPKVRLGVRAVAFLRSDLDAWLHRQRVS